MAVHAFSLTDAYYRFTKVRCAGRFEREGRQSG